MLSYTFEYNGFILNDPITFYNVQGAFILSVGGLSSPEVVHREDSLVGQHGIVDYYSFIGDRIISLEGIIVGKNEEEMYEKLEEFTSAFTLPAVPETDRTGYHYLIMEKTGEISKQVSCKIHSLPRIDKDLHVHKARKFYVELRCEDPRITSVEEHLQVLTHSNQVGFLPMSFPVQLGLAGAWDNAEVVVNEGNFGSLPRYRIYGPCTNPTLRNASYADILQRFNVTLEDGEYIDVDSKEGTAIKNDGTNMIPFESDDSKWITLLPGNNTMAAVLNDPLGSISLYWNDTWLSVPR